MDINLTSQKIYSSILEAKRILIVSHQRPDADAFGSMLALGYWLDTLGKNHVKLAYDLPPQNLAWLANYKPLFVSAVDLSQDFDLLIVLDSSDLAHAGADRIIAALPARPKIINIDHHATNVSFGDINLVLPQAVSTSEIIYQFFSILKIQITKNIASAILAGIIYDSYNFTNPNTNYQSLETAAKMLIAGASLNQVSDSILKNKSIESLKIWGEILMRLKYNQDWEIASTYVTLKDLENQPDNTDITEGIANFLNNLTGIKALLVIQELPDNLIKGSLRTNNDLIDVAKLAKIFGGGGHQKAAGFKIKGRLITTADGHWSIQ
ncbi:MAG: bifunctional oligoribonuclease/PAP phosphatase NrnA [Candidatus Buchananbacteria bacterium]